MSDVIKELIQDLEFGMTITLRARSGRQLIIGKDSNIGREGLIEFLNKLKSKS